MIITAQFTRDSLGVNSLTPTLTVVDVSDGTFVLDGVAMSPIANGAAPGWYKYDFTAYDDTVDYIITADAQTDLVDDRYPVTTNQNTSVDLSGLATSAEVNNASLRRI